MLIKKETKITTKKNDIPFNILEIDNMIKFLEKKYSNDITTIDYSNPDLLFKRIGQIELINDLKKTKREIEKYAS